MKIEESVLRKIIVYSISRSLCYNCGFHETQCLLSGKGGVVRGILIPSHTANTIEEEEGYTTYTTLLDKRWLGSLNRDCIIGGSHTHPQDSTPTKEDLISIVESEKLWGHPCEDLIVSIPNSVISDYMGQFKNKGWFRGPFAWWLNFKDARLKRKYSDGLCERIRGDHSSYLCAYLSDGSLQPVEIV